MKTISKVLAILLPESVSKTSSIAAIEQKGVDYVGNGQTGNGGCMGFRTHLLLRDPLIAGIACAGRLCPFHHGRQYRQGSGRPQCRCAEPPGITHQDDDALHDLRGAARRAASLGPEDNDVQEWCSRYPLEALCATGQDLHRARGRLWYDRQIRQ
ncbi:hypothetical protein D3C72_1817300 [compost metagenome]